MPTYSLRPAYTEEEWDDLEKEASRLNIPLKQLLRNKLLHIFGGVCDSCRGIEVKRITKRIDVELPGSVGEKIKCTALVERISFNSLVTGVIISKKDLEVGG